jgi:hypothetical protein
VVEGELTFQVGDELITKRVGELAFAGRGAPHTLANLITAPYSKASPGPNHAPRRQNQQAVHRPPSSRLSLPHQRNEARRRRSSVCHWVGSWDRKRLVKGGVATIQKVRGRGYFWGRIGGASPYVFFAVDDIGAAIERVRQLGGEVDEVNDEGTRTRSRGLAASSFVATTRARGSGSTSRLRHSRGRDHEEVRRIRSDEALAFTAEDLYRDSRQLRRSRVGARTSRSRLLGTTSSGHLVGC